ncbi:MAG: PD-(D/E)XK nuclease family protein [Methylophilaceae bacterium]
MLSALSSKQTTTYICATARLARALQKTIHQQQITDQQVQWLSPSIYTLPQWLQTQVHFALLAGECSVDRFPVNALNSFTEKLLWQEAITQCLTKHELTDLFDIPNLAQSSIEANQRLIEWQISDTQINAHFMTSETRQFLRWRNTFHQLCAQYHTLEPARLLEQQVKTVISSTLPLPGHMAFIGFDRMTPLEQFLIDALKMKGVHIEIRHAQAAHQNLSQIGLADIHAECRAAVAWAQQRLSTNPHANLAIVCPVLATVRRPLADLLDDTFHPQTLNPSQNEMPRLHDFSLGLALNEQAMVRTALNLLQLATSEKPIAQSDASALLLDVYWGVLYELDDRSLLDAQLRKKLTRTFKLQALYALTCQCEALTHLPTHLDSLLATQQNWRKKQLPSIWAQRFAELLQALNWSQTRALSSHEYQIKQAWSDTFTSLAGLDKLTGTVTAYDALQKLQQLCSTTMFQAEAIGDVRIQVLGILESTVTPLDGVWIMAMNDQYWPPPTNLNALLPAGLQRQLQTPGANPDVQSVFAQKIHVRLCNSATEVIFSWSHKEDDRELRISPLLANIPLRETADQAETMTERLAQPSPMQVLEDSAAPPLQANDQLRGGSKLIEAQVICPAWAFYQYRLGAKKLDTPSEGLDSMARGNLVHAVLQHFWLDCKDSKTLNALSPQALEQMGLAAIDKALQQMKNELRVTLPAQIITIERHRLQQLLQTWLTLEKQRPDFSVRDCEATHLLSIEGLEITCRIDRIDTLEDGGLVVIDYKTGTLPALKAWAEKRIHEPQLPLYASLALQNQRVVAACFARVNFDECKFGGVASDKDLLPSVTAFTELKNNSPFVTFENFPALITHWQESLKAIATEIKSGKAGVVFEDGNDLAYCDVTPLLRLPERALQFEQKKCE